MFTFLQTQGCTYVSFVLFFETHDCQFKTMDRKPCRIAIRINRNEKMFFASSLMIYHCDCQNDVVETNRVKKNTLEC